MTLQEQLKELDAKATQGKWVAHDVPYNGHVDPVILSGEQYIAQTVYDRQSLTVRDEVDADTLLITALVNAYRSGQLVPLPEVEEARLAALEEAAKVAEDSGHFPQEGAHIAQAIRDLADKGKV